MQRLCRPEIISILQLKQKQMKIRSDDHGLFRIYYYYTCIVLRNFSLRKPAKSFVYNLDDRQRKGTCFAGSGFSGLKNVQHEYNLYISSPNRNNRMILQFFFRSTNYYLQLKHLHHPKSMELLRLEYLEAI